MLNASYTRVRSRLVPKQFDRDNLGLPRGLSGECDFDEVEHLLRGPRQGTPCGLGTMNAVPVGNAGNIERHDAMSAL